jgi:hypothetical protein
VVAELDGWDRERDTPLLEDLAERNVLEAVGERRSKSSLARGNSGASPAKKQVTD